MTASDATTAVDVSHHPESDCFEARIGDALAGVAQYEQLDTVRDFDHTLVYEGFEGKGVASALIRHALDATRDEEMKVRATCSFVARWIEKHPDYQDLLA